VTPPGLGVISLMDPFSPGGRIRGTLAMYAMTQFPKPTTTGSASFGLLILSLSRHRQRQRSLRRAEGPLSLMRNALETLLGMGLRLLEELLCRTHTSIISESLLHDTPFYGTVVSPRRIRSKEVILAPHTRGNNLCPKSMDA